MKNKRPLTALRNDIMLSFSRVKLKLKFFHYYLSTVLRSNLEQSSLFMKKSEETLVPTDYALFAIQRPNGTRTRHAFLKFVQTNKTFDNVI